jgi:hypothetical protein
LIKLNNDFGDGMGALGGTFIMGGYVHHKYIQLYFCLPMKILHVKFTVV